MTPEVKENNEVPVSQNTDAKEKVQAAPVEQKETLEQINWKHFREQREKDRKQREEIEARAKQKEEEASALKLAMEALLTKAPSREQEQYEETEDDRIQKRIDAALAAREKQYIEERNKKEAQEFPQRLSANYKDFNQVCSTDNIDYMEYHYPEIYTAYKYMPDGYEKWESVYKAIKKLIPNAISKKDEAKADRNMSKPQSMASPNKTQIGDSAPVILDEARRKDNWSRMQRIMKGG